MENIVNKIKSIRDNLAKEHGPFRLFGLFLKDDSIDSWDLLISSEWVCENKKVAIGEVSKSLVGVMTSEEMKKITAVFIVERETPIIGVLSGIAGHMKNSHIKNCSVNGIEIKDAYILDYDPQI